ncbi:MAG TPA: HisA/HisF-related TIM barrel protein [Actinomycetota bacterium]|nr:HisA/HisF-related TIM barrel protein [Actinomycetota bacterium]
MAFDVIPAVDISRGGVARLVGGDPSSLERAGGNPEEMVRGWIAEGARWVHVVDLDAALSGEPGNLDLLERVCALDVLVEAGGGLSEAGVAAALERGATRAILGAAALLEAESVERAVAAHGDRVAVGLDVRDGVVAPRGRGLEGPTVDEAMRRIAAARPALVVYTEAARDGTMRGVDAAAIARAAAALGVPVIASGGVGSVDDLRALAVLYPAAAGAIVGRALHTGAFTLEEALAAVR